MRSAWFASHDFVQRRILILGFLLASELSALSLWIAPRTQQIIGTKHHWGGALILQAVVVYTAIFVAGAYLKNKTTPKDSSDPIKQAPIRWGLLAAHCSVAIVFAKLLSRLYLEGGLGSSRILAAGWLAAGISAIAFAGFTFLPWPAWMQLLRRTGHLWLYASIAAVSAIVFEQNLQQWLWQTGPAIHLTFRLTRLFLSPFVSDIFTNPAKGVIGTHRFRVRIEPGCSGLEGVGLILIFVTLWLLVFRKECRFPRSLVLLPLGAILIFLFNAARIAALVLIGNAGAKQIAVNGFHSQAGWIAFSAVSVCFCLVIQSVPWFTLGQQNRESLGAVTHNPTAAYLLPFVVILAAGMIGGAARGAGAIEWLYPLRFFAAAGALWAFRTSYADLNWRFDWLAPAIGAAVFVIWIVLDRSSNAAIHPTIDRGMSAILTAAPTLTRMGWITFRVLAAVITVPLAEEVAFRGYLMRRLISADFEAVSLKHFSWFALLVSSLIFGVLHGGYWVAGVLAGILFGLAVLRRGRIGDAVVAHATANALLAAYILVYHKWHLW